MIAEAQLAINEMQIDDIQDAKYEIAKNINKIATKHTQNSTKEERQKLKTLQNVKRKLKNNNIIHVKADKGNGLVLINKNEYINKTLEFIKENNFMEIKKNPTNKYQREIKQLIKSSPKIFQNNSEGTINTGIHQNSSQNLRNKIAYELTKNNPSPPVMKALPKIINKTYQ